ncbi:nucleoprotein [Muir Springs virus]|uniref:Nucleoprotein n=1 Tax=Muir Springs virus TaxID=932700 RepID=A0A0D3R124_9RHAB|nr:nucleoprotein [Muir Springs virus]AJR28338.1 nucleoprotein [Muir Springs virus]
MAVAILPVSRNLPARNRTVAGSVTAPPVQYPSEWFRANENRKVSITIYQQTTAGQAYSRIEALRNNGQWDDVLISTFMRGVIDENAEWFQSAPLTEDWSVNGAVIGQTGASITPLNLATWETIPRPGNLGPIANQEGELETRRSFFLALVTIYRQVLTRDINAEYGQEVSRRIIDNFKEQPLAMSQDDINNIQNFETKDKLTANYVKVLCILDMFFNKFQNHDKSTIRIATLPTRYRGCAAFTSYGELAIRLGIEPVQLPSLILTMAVARDFDKINIGGEQAEHLDGYFPYQLTLGLVKKSAYSASNCPALYLWMHTIGTMLYQQRSYRAQVPKNVPDQMGTINSAIAVAIQYVAGGDFSMQFVADARVQGAMREMQDAEAELTHLRQLTARAARQAAEGNVNDEGGDEGESSEDEEEEDDHQLDDQDDPEIAARLERIGVLQENLRRCTATVEQFTSVVEKSAMRALAYLQENGGIAEKDRRELGIRFRRFADEADGRVGKLLANLFPAHR